MSKNIAVLKAEIRSLHQQLDLIARQKVELFETYEYCSESGVNLTANLLVKLNKLEFEETQIQETIVAYQKQLKKLQGGK